MGKKRYRPKSKVELLREQLERERPRPPRPAAGWMQAAAERANRAQAAIAEKAESGKIIFSAEAVARAPEVLPDAGREGPAIGGLRVTPKVPGKQGAGKGAVSPSAILGD